jgi:hypothetical protein
MLKTTYIDPSFSSSSRVEFKLLSSDECILNTIEICNFGFSSATGTANPALKFGGLYNVIKNAYLYSGNMEIDSIRDVCSVAGASLLWGDADGAVSVANEQTQTSQTATFASTSLNLLAPLNVQLSGNVKLTDIFPFLASTKLLVNYPDLRVVLELNTVIADMFTAPNPTAIVVATPFMKFESVADEMAKKALLADKANYAPVMWNTIYTESVQVGAGTSSLKLRGFSGKVVTDIIAQSLIDQSDAVLGFGYSFLSDGEIMNLTVNNRKLLPLNGLDSSAKKMMSMEKFKQMGYFGTAMTSGTGMTTFGNSANSLFNRISFARFEVLNRITDLQFDYTRGAQAGAAAVTSIRFIGNVLKSMTRDSSGKVLLVQY